MHRRTLSIPQDTVKRLSLYLRILSRLGARKVKVASSGDITSFLHISPVQLRKDLSYFGEFGRRGVGYDVQALKGEIEKILGTNVIRKIALVGVGKLGSALLGYPGFTEFNLQICAAFDTDARKVGRAHQGIRIEHLCRLKRVVKDQGIKIAILAVSADAAQNVSEDLVNSGIKAILNFSPVNLALPVDVYVSNVDMASELESLVYKLTQR